MWALRRCSLYETGSFLKWNFQRWLCTANKRPSLQSYGNICSRDYEIGLSNLVLIDIWWERDRTRLYSMGWLCNYSGKDVLILLFKYGWSLILKFVTSVMIWLVLTKPLLHSVLSRHVKQTLVNLESPTDLSGWFNVKWYELYFLPCSWSIN